MTFASFWERVRSTVSVLAWRLVFTNDVRVAKQPPVALGISDSLTYSYIPQPPHHSTATEGSASGPPCQPFSKSANWRNPHGAARGLKDGRADTIAQYLRVLREAQPAAFLLENVFGLAYRVNQAALRLLQRGIAEAGYTFACGVLNAADFGVPQIRERFFLVGARKDLRPQGLQLPSPTHGEGAPLLRLKPYATAKEAFDGLPPQQVTPELVLRGKHAHLLPLVPPGENYLHFTAHRGHPKPLFRWRSRYWSFLLKLHPNRPSWTIQASPGPAIGPFHWENRRLTIEEIRRIQTFPDSYTIVGSRHSVQRQLGNAVPCMLARVIGDAIQRQLFERGSRSRWC